MVVSLFLFAIFTTNGVNGGRGGWGKGGRGGKGGKAPAIAPTYHVRPPHKTAEAWTSLTQNDYDPNIAKATWRFGARKIANGKGEGKGGFDPIKDRGNKKYHEMMPDGRESMGYSSFYYGVTSDANLDAYKTAKGKTGARVVVEHHRPGGGATGRYWMTEHLPGDNGGYQNWSLPKDIFAE